MTGFARPELLASTEWLAEQLGRADVRVIDVRWRPDGSGQAAYEAGHIPGATHVDWREDMSEARAGDVDAGATAGTGGIAGPGDLAGGPAIHLAGPDRIVALMARCGVGDGSTVVLYDDTLGLFAARAWWGLRVYGLESRILDGGIPTWVGEGRPLSTGVLPHPDSTFTPRLNPRLRLTTADVRALLGSPDVQILDARANPEYRGFEGNARRLGHIPGAINVPVGAMHEAGAQRLRDPEEIRTLLLRANVAKGRRLVCYDGSGVGAARLAFVLTLMGYDDVAVYDGGWSEWGDRLDLPVER